MILLYARVILQEKKNWAVQFTNCTALSDFVNCTALYDSTQCQSHFARKKKLGRCNLQIAPPYLKLLYGKVICKKKKFGWCNLQIAPPRAVGWCMHHPSRCNLVISLINSTTLEHTQKQQKQKRNKMYPFYDNEPIGDARFDPFTGID